MYLTAIVILLLLVAPGTGHARADDLPPVNSSAFFQTFDDSLGYDEFRALDADRQLELRRKARQWVQNSRDAVAASRGLDGRPQVGRMSIGEQQQYLVRAMNAAATAVGYCPYMAEAWIAYAEVANFLGDYRVALACLAHAQKTIPYERSEDTRSENLLALNRIEALAAYNVGEYDRALASAQYVLDHQGGAWDTRLLAARCMIQIGRFDDARSLIGSMPQDSPNHAAALGVLGVAEMHKGDLAAAERAFERASDKGLRDPVFENDRGRLALAQDRPADACAHFRRAASLTPRFFEARNNLAVAQRRSGDLAAAEQTLARLLDEVPDYAPGRFNLAELYRERALETEGAEREAWVRQAWREYSLALEFGYEPERVLERRGTLSVHVQDLQSAEEDLLALTGDPAVTVEVLTILARVKKEQGRLDIAEQVLLMATLREDAGALAFAELGEVQLRRSDPASARVALEQACALDPGLVVSRLNLSIACHQLGDDVAARAALEEAARLAPDHPMVLDQRRVLSGSEQP